MLLFLLDYQQQIDRQIEMARTQSLAQLIIQLMKQAVDVFEAFLQSANTTPIPIQIQPPQFGELFICNSTLPGLNLIEQLKGRRIMKISGGQKHTYVFEESSETQNTITALHTGEDDRIQEDGRTTASIEQAISCLEGNKIVDISTGQSHVMLLTQEGQLYSYGFGQHGVLGHGGSYFEQKPRIIRKLCNRIIKQISCGMFHTLALSDYGDVYAWGKGFQGQLGIRKDLQCCSAPQLIGGFYKYAEEQIGYLKKTIIKQIACGANHSMAIDQNGNLYCWGEARFGQTGNGRKVKQPLPIIVQIKNRQQKKKIKKVSGGFGHTLCLTEDGDLFSWGLNIKGQVGINDISENAKINIFDTELKNIKAVHFPSLLETDNSKNPLPKFLNIACGFNSSFGIDINGLAWGWGGDTNGFRDQGHCERAPRKILENTQDRKFNRIFANRQTVVFFAPIRTLSFNPIIGPSKGSTQVTFFGTGFAQTGFQKVKFTFGQKQLIVDAQYEASGCTYFCKTPDFQQICKVFPSKWKVSVSLDGQEFYSYDEQYLVYSSSLTAESIEPKSASSKGGQQLTLSIHLPEQVYEYTPSITVGFRLSDKNQPQQVKKSPWICVQGTYSEGEIKCFVPKIDGFNQNNPFYHVDISINGQQFSGLPNTIRFYELSNLSIQPNQGYQQGNIPIVLSGNGLFDSTRKKIKLKVLFSEKAEQLELGRQIQVINWDKLQKRFIFQMPPLSWLLCGNEATPELVSSIKNGSIDVKLTLSGVQWINIGQFKFVDPPPPPPEPEQEKDTKKGAKKATKK